MNPPIPNPSPRAPLTEVIAVSLASVVDDGRDEIKREPTHYDLDVWCKTHGLTPGDPKGRGEIVGKRKRVLSMLRWAIESDLDSGGAAVSGLIALVRGSGGFRVGSANFIGAESIANAQAAFGSEGFVLGADGELRAQVLDNLSEAEMSEALGNYARRAKRGVEDAALVVGTGKDLLEATAAHVIHSVYGAYPARDVSFPMLLGQAFVAAKLATPQDAPKTGEPAQRAVERSLFDLACAVNRLRNREGTGHGRPWLPTVTAADARCAIEAMGIIAERLLRAVRPGS